jgi:hypothetical protein
MNKKELVELFLDQDEPTKKFISRQCYLIGLFDSSRTMLQNLEIAIKECKNLLKVRN